MNNKKTHHFNNVSLVINQVSDFYVIYANIEKRQKLTQQEHNVMMLLTKGATNKKIATALTLSPSTINNHLTHIFKKLRVNSRISAVQEWKKNDK
jgi:DNA-binding NarL/FixJ family response regulator